MTARVQVPATAKRGEVIEIRIAIQHPMETGFRLDDGGRAIRKNVVNKFACRYNGVEVFRAELHPSVSANPFIQFSTVATESGTLEFKWSGDNGFSTSQTARITVT